MINFQLFSTNKELIKQNLIFDIDEIKDFLRISNKESDNLLQKLAKIAINRAENYLGWFINSYNIKLIYKYQLFGKIILPYAPINKWRAIEIINKNQILEISDKQYFILNDEILFLKQHIYAEQIILNYESGSYDENKINDEIKLALLRDIEYLFNSRNYNQEKLDNYEVMLIYNKYRKFGI